jgi:4-amino-4-deoxy-L-arabinose transferase-like glycosyltransferase
VKAWFFVLVGGFIATFIIVTVTSVAHKSPTYDETIHLFAGYSYLTRSDFRVNPEHPPLGKALAALPLFFMDVNDIISVSPYWDLALEHSSHAWTLARRMIFENNDAERLFYYARFPMIALAILLGVGICAWARELYGSTAAILALLFYVSDPNILAYSPLIHTDIPFTTFFFLATYFLWRSFEREKFRNIYAAWLLFSLSAITKYSFFSILPIWGVLGITRMLSPEPLGSMFVNKGTARGWRMKTAVVVPLLLFALVAAYLATWAAYSFRFKATAGDAPHLNFAALSVPAGIFSDLVLSVAGARLLPEAPLYGLLYVLQFLDRPAYLLGQTSNDGFWLYFPVAFAVKTPLPTLLLLSVAGWLFCKRRRCGTEFWLLIPVVIYFSIAVFSRLNIGFRHLLPIYPFLFVIVGLAAAWLWSGNRVKRVAMSLLVAWQIGISWHVYPHYLAYFNEFIGGPKNGHKVLTDSSLDWGQDLKGLKVWMDENSVKAVQLGYFGTADPKYYGIEAVYLPGSMVDIRSSKHGEQMPKPNYLAVSVTYLYGIYSGEPLRSFYVPLREKQPVSTIGHSIFVYKLD